MESFEGSIEGGLEHKSTIASHHKYLTAVKGLMKVHSYHASLFSTFGNVSQFYSLS